MGDKSKIEWTDATWNCVTGCTKVSPGCDRCYAERVTERFHGPGSFARVQLHEDKIELPRRWRRPRRVFVNSMSDLFHDDVPDEFIARMWQVMATTPQHTYQILTKRHARMRSWVNRCAVSPGGWITHDGTDPAGATRGTGLIVGYHEPAHRTNEWDHGPRGGKLRHKPSPVAYGWPLPNVWLGVSVEDQKWADIRIPALLETPAAIRFLSCEPLLGPVNLRGYLSDPPWIDGALWPPSNVRERSFDWVIAGGESGPGARPMHPDWARRIRDDCQAARVPFFFKQFGEYLPVAVFDDPLMAGGRAWANPEGGKSSASIRERSPGPFRTGVTRLMRPGESNGWGTLLDADTMALRVGKKRAGRELDGRTWDEYPQQARAVA